jgi:NitT/TauT family transport system ATP-binding protein
LTGDQSRNRSSGASVVVDRVSKSFATDTGITHAIEEASFSIEAEQFVSIIGPSGCGKTTVVRMVGDLLTPTSGTILVDDETPDVARKHRQFGFVFQSATLLEWRSLLENVMLPLDVLKWPRQEKRDKAGELLELVGLGDFGDHYPDQVSGGMQQRVSIARALSYDPGILIMDEPFGALDMITRDRMGLELLRIWSEAQKTVLFVTHSIDEAVLLSDVVIVMSPRPSQIQQIVPIDLERPRSIEQRRDPRFIEYTQALREMLI